MDNFINQNDETIIELHENLKGNIESLNQFYDTIQELVHEKYGKDFDKPISIDNSAE